MTFLIREYPSVPEGHPFKTFLSELPRDEGCDPRPDFIEGANRSRYFCSFMSQNANARMTRFAAQVETARPGVQIMTQRCAAASACCTLFLNELKPYPDSGQLPRQTTLFLAPPNVYTAPVEEPKGYVHMPSY